MKYMFSVLYMVQWNAVIHDSQPTSVYKVNTVSRRTTSWIPAKLKENGGNKESAHYQKWRSKKKKKMLNRASLHAWPLSNNARIQPSYYLCPTSYPETGAEKQEQALSDRHCHVFAPYIQSMVCTRNIFISSASQFERMQMGKVLSIILQTKWWKKKKVYKKTVCKQNW